MSDTGNAEEITPGLGLDDTVPTTTSTTTTIATQSTPATLPAPTTSTTPVQTESVQLWFVNGALLNPITTSMPSPATLNQVLGALQRGPARLPPATLMRSAVPTTPRLSATDNEDGTATVDLPVDFFSTIQTANQLPAIAQIVLTLTLRPGIGGVNFTSGGEPVAVSLGNGEQSTKGQTVTRADYRTLTGEEPLPTSSTTSTTTSTTPATTTAPPESAAVEPTTTQAG